jgi:hypothetical protein
VLDRSRVAQLVWAALCLGLFVLVAVAVQQDWSLLRDFDDRGNGLEGWAVDEAWLRHPLRWVELAFNTIGMTVLTVLLALVMFLKNHRRAAYLTVGVMVATSLATTGLKLWIGRDRPPRQNP